MLPSEMRASCWVFTMYCKRPGGVVLGEVGGGVSQSIWRLWVHGSMGMSPSLRRLMLRLRSSVGQRGFSPGRSCAATLFRLDLPLSLCSSMLLFHA